MEKLIAKIKKLGADVSNSSHCMIVTIRRGTDPQIVAQIGFLAGSMSKKRSATYSTEKNGNVTLRVF